MNIGNSLLSLLTVVALIIVGEVLRLKFSKKLYFGLSLLGLGAAYYFINANDSSLNIFASQMQYSRLGGFFVSIFIGLMFSVFLVLLFQKHMLPRSVELTLILFLMLVGAIVAVFSINALNFFVAFELVSLSLYLLVGFKRDQFSAKEAALKYFLLGSVSAAFLLYGIAFLFGATGSFQLSDWQAALQQLKPEQMAFFQLGALLFLTGIVFKIGAVPFHFWIPDVYQGASTLVTALMATLVKAFSVFIFIQWIVFSGLIELPLMKIVLPILIAATFVVGTLLALTQKNLARLLAYSSIVNAGFLLLGLYGGIALLPALLFYLVIYIVMTFGGFLVIYYLESEKEEPITLEALGGLFYSHPLLASALSLVLLSLAGMPPLAGFNAKWILITKLFGQNLFYLAALGLLTTLISFYYYLTPVIRMFFESNNSLKIDFKIIPGIIILGLVLTILFLGIWPSPLLGLPQVLLK
jgi:NADH-quinone oxidoreductase subunit N